MSDATDGPTPVLEFQRVSIGTPPPRCAAVRDANLRLAPGEMALIRTRRDQPHSALVPAAEGLWDLDGGSVSFEGEAWSDRSALRHNARRGRIGRVFSGCGWVSNLNVNENVTLPERHHTSRSTSEIEAEAETLAKRFGLPGVPHGRPSFIPESVLRRAEWVRALLGKRALLLLEEPMRGVDRKLLPNLVGAVDEARDRGAAVLWITEDPAVLGHEFRQPLKRLAMRDNELVTAEEAA